MRCLFLMFAKQYSFGAIFTATQKAAFAEARWIPTWKPPGEQRFEARKARQRRRSRWKKERKRLARPKSHTKANPLVIKKGRSNESCTLATGANQRWYEKAGKWRSYWANPSLKNCKSNCWSAESGTLKKVNTPQLQLARAKKRSPWLRRRTIGGGGPKKPERLFAAPATTTEKNTA